MSVVVQEMVSPDVAGTAFSIEVSTGFPAIHLAASYGLGEAVVSGHVTSDEWLIHTASLKTIKRVKGSKKEMCITEEGKSGVIWAPVPDNMRDRLCMKDHLAKQLAEKIIIIQKVYISLFGYEHVDTEFGISKKGDIRMLQSRPVVELDTASIQTVD